jgi:hypothetical protein
MRLPVRRTFAALAIAVAAIASACTGGGTPKPSASPDSLQALCDGASNVNLISTQSPVNPGPNEFSFGLITDQGGVVTGGTPSVYLAKSQTDSATGPTKATWYPFAPASATDDTSPRTALPGTYATQFDVAGVGRWIVGVVVTQGSDHMCGNAALEATDQAIPAPVGSKAISVKTPVATTPRELRKIDTRVPPSPLHYISLDRALKNGKPTVVAFATPLLCESMLCGPVVDEVLLAYQDIGKDQANFIHVEEFLPGDDFTPPPATLENQSPGFKAYGFSTEPWTLVIDRKGVIRARFEGPVTSAMIEAALQPLL